MLRLLPTAAVDALDAAIQAQDKLLLRAYVNHDVRPEFRARAMEVRNELVRQWWRAWEAS